jgi:hypothetical protein
MRRPVRVRVSPSLVVSVVALFFALGGSAAALRSSSAKVVKCPAGSVRAVAIITGDPAQGIENLPADFSGSAKLFSYRWSCSGAPASIQIRKSTRDTGAGGYRGFDIRFAGNPGKVVVANGASDSPVAASSAPVGDGSFHISTGGDLHQASFTPRSTSVVVVLF